MPKVHPDNELRQSLIVFVTECGGYSSAARQLGMSRATVWRFATKATGLDRTRLKLAQRLQAHASETKETLEAVKMHGSRPVPVELGELERMRAYCQRMIEWIDTVEKSSGLAARDFGVMDGVKHGTRKG